MCKYCQDALIGMAAPWVFARQHVLGWKPYSFQLFSSLLGNKKILQRSLN